jgi:uncharacterized lipoprotein
MTPSKASAIQSLKGVRWRFDTISRVIYIEGRSDKRIQNAVDFFQERIEARIAQTSSQ